MSELPEPRIADVDRDRVSQHLRLAYGEGRITEGELEERLAAVYEAKTASELNVVVADLPVPPVAIARPVIPAPPTKVRSSFRLEAAVPLLMPPLICTAIYFMTNAGGYFWPMWVWLGCGIPAVYAILGSRNDDSDAAHLPSSAPPEVSS